jgi:ankyrin repeat protein
MVPDSVERNEERNLVFDILKTLLDRGIDPNAEDKEGLTALDHALPICPYNVIEYFIKKGAKITKHLLQKPDDLFTHAEGILGEERFRKPEFYAGDAFLRARAVNPKWGKGWLPNIGAYVRVS